MNRKTIDEADIRAVAQEKKLPLEIVLSRFVLLEFARLIAKSTFSGRLLCVNPRAINSETDSGVRTGNTILKYHYILNPGENFDRASFTYVLKSAVKYVDDTAVEYSWQTEIEGERLKINVQGSLGDLMVPFCVYVESGKEMLRPQNVVIPDVMSADEEYQIYIYPASSKIAADMLVIIRDLDFIADMGYYESIYQTLKTMEYDARHLQKAFFDMMSSEEVPVDDERFEMIRNYTASSRMKKRWSSHIKKKKRSEVLWEDVIKTIMGAFETIWNAQKAGEVFIGDWMPELGKYL